MTHNAVLLEIEVLRKALNAVIAEYFPADIPVSGPADTTSMERVVDYVLGHPEIPTEIEAVLMHQCNTLSGSMNTPAQQPPIFWRTTSPYGEIWNAAWVSSHRDDMLTIAMAAKLTGWSIQRIKGMIARNAINTWPNPAPTHAILGNKLVSRREVFALFARLEKSKLNDEQPEEGGTDR